MKTRHLASILMTLVLPVCIIACGTREGNDRGNDNTPSLNLTPFEQLTGQWSGIYRGLDSGKPLGDAVAATMNLLADGAFNMSLDSDPSARVEGSWAEFQGRSLILKISGSTIPRIGISGKVVEPAYELLGSSLRVTTENFELKLAKKSTDSSSPTNGDHSRFDGTWLCDDGGGRKTKLAITEDKTFTLASQRAGERIFVSQGTVLSREPALFHLIPSSSSDPLPEGSFFEFQLAAGKAELRLNKGQPTQIAKIGICRK